MSIITKIDEAARRACTHTVVYTDPTDRLIGALALQGISTKAIANMAGLSESAAQYRVCKAQNSFGDGRRFRRDYRSGKGAVVQKMLKATQVIALQVVDKQIAPKFIPFARQGVARLIRP
jgi:hypothetical protein